MRIAVAGAHGQVARRLTRLLTARGDSVVGLIRNPDHRADLEADGAEPAVLDLEHAALEEVADVLAGADAAVFAAGAGPSSGAERKHTVDYGAACCWPTPPSGPVCAPTCWSPRWVPSWP